MKTLKLELGRALGSREFAGAVAAFVLCALLGIWRPLAETLSETELRTSGYWLTCLDEGLASQYLLLALPVLGALPYASSFVCDAVSRFLRSYLPRCGRRNFLRSRTAVTALSGAAVMAAGSLFTAFVLALVLLPREMRPDPLVLAELGAQQSEIVRQIVQRVALLAVAGALWALVGALAAALTMNRQLALGAPFIFYYLLIILSTRYFPEMETLNPRLWAAPFGSWDMAPLAAGTLMLEISAAAAMCLMLLLDRRLADV